MPPVLLLSMAAADLAGSEAVGALQQAFPQAHNPLLRASLTCQGPDPSTRPKSLGVW
jgi:hypothetical protein